MSTFGTGVFGSNYGATGLGTNGFEVSLNYFTAVPDPNILTCSAQLKLIFKTLLKRDVTTKEKSISEFLEYVDTHSEEIEDDLVVITWVQLYAKLSIDTSKKVRQFSHQIQSRFVSQLSKKYMKYLRDTIGIWLAGFFDSERIVSKACITSVLDAFGNNEEKVNNLWKLFHEQILNYCLQVFAYETKDSLSDERFVGKDESDAKFDRVTLATIQMFTKELVVIHNDPSFNIKTESQTIMQSIISNDKVTELFESKDLQIKRSMYVMIKTLVLTFPDYIDSKIFKNYSKGMIKGLKLVNSKKGASTNPLLFSYLISHILDSLITVTKYNAELWSVKKANSILVELLTLGSCNSDTYYNYLFPLLDVLPDSVVSLNNYESIQPIVSSLENNILKERLPKFVSGAWASYLKFIIKSSKEISETEVSGLVERAMKLFIQSLDTPRLLTQEVIESLVLAKDVVDDDEDILSKINYEIINVLPCGPLSLEEQVIDVKNTSGFIINFLSVLVASQSDILDSFIENAVESLDDEYEGSPMLSFYVVQAVIRKNLVKYESSVITALEKLPDHIKSSDSTFNAFVFTILSELNASQFDTAKNNLHELINSVYLKVNTDDKQVEELLHTVSKFKDLDINKCEDLNNYLHEKSSTGKDEPTRDPTYETSTSSSIASADYSILFKFVTPEILSNVYNNGNCNIASFVRNCNEHYQNEPFVTFIQTGQGTEFLNYLFSAQSDAESAQLLTKLEENLKHNESLQGSYLSSLKSYALGLSTLKDINMVVMKLKNVTTTESIVKYFFNAQSQLLSDLNDCISEYPVSDLSISNPLGTLIYGFGGTSNPEDFIKDKEAFLKLIREAYLLFGLIEEFNLELSGLLSYLISITIISDCAVDYNFLQNSAGNDKASQEFEDKVLEFQTASFSKLSTNFENVKLENQLIEIFTDSVEAGDETVESLRIFGFLNTAYNDYSLNLRFYSCCVFKKLLSNHIENETAQNFSQLKINFNKLLSKNPIKLGVLVSSSKKFLTSIIFDRIRNGVAAELTAIRKSSDILSKGLVYIQILNCFLDFDTECEIPSDFSPIPGQRFMMLLNALQSWLDSDIAYDEEFVPVKIELMKFSDIFINKIARFIDLSNFPSEFKTKVFDMDFKLMGDSLNYVNSDMHIPLEYYSLKSFILLSCYTDEIEEWKEEIGSIHDELIELLFVSAKQEKINQASKLTNTYISRIFDNYIPLKKLSSRYDDMFTMIDSKSTDTQSLITNILLKFIPEVQDELVVEMTLKKKSAPTEDENGAYKEEIGAKLPEALIKNISSPLEDYIEFEDQSEINRYAFSWLLIFKHFKNITAKIRHDYLAQLRESIGTPDMIFSFLQYAVTQLDVSSNELIQKILSNGKEYITEFDILSDFDYLDPLESNRRMLTHLIYSALVEVGSVVQAWFNSIRDKQLKMNVEKLIIKCFSPIIIDTEFTRLSESKLTTTDQFTVKLNRLADEIKCSYLIDEKTLEMTLGLPENYPLSNIVVTGTTRRGVTEKKWKAWMLSVQYILHIQNGTIKDAITNFETNIKMNFAGYEECDICYSILHATDSSTANKACSTCKHTFHAACLYRWFKSSGGTTCPLCRNKFNFKRQTTNT